MLKNARNYKLLINDHQRSRYNTKTTRITQYTTTHRKIVVSTVVVEWKAGVNVHVYNVEVDSITCLGCTIQ